jgi:RHS repeat-associated protein
VQQLQTTFDTNGRVTQYKDAKGNPVNFAYDTTALSATATYPNLPGGSQSATATFDSRGNVKQVSDPTGAQSSATYNNPSTNPAAKDLPDTVTQVRRNADGSTTSFTTSLTYDTKGEITSTTDPTGAVTRVTYGSFGEAVTVSDPLGNTVTNVYDVLGNLLSTVTAAGVTTIYSYDSHNNLVSVTQGVRRSTGATQQNVTQMGATTNYSYDSQNQLVSSTSPTGVTTNFAYDANGNQTGTNFTWVNPNNASQTQLVTTSAVFDAEDRQTQSIDVYSHASVTKYDAKGRVTETDDVLGNPTKSVFDARDQVIQTTNPDGTINDTVYDAEGRVSYTDDTHVSGQSDVHGTHTIYDSMGRATETDRLDNVVISVTTTNGVSSSQLVSSGALLSSTKSTYNDLGQVTQSTDAANQPTKYQYDAAGRQTSVTDALTETTSTGYDAAGRATTTTDALGHVTQQVFDGDDKVVKTIFADGSYTQTAYDFGGRQASVTDQMARTTQYQYDTPGRLTAVVLPGVTDPSSGKTVNPTTNYSYDNYGNLTQIKDALTRTTNFSFDAFGHQLTRTLPMTQSESMTYDAYGRLATHTDFKGQQEVYHYDSLGRNDTKTFYPPGSQTAGETITYHFDNLGRNDTVTDVIGSTSRVTSYGFDLDNRTTSITTPEGTVNYVFDPATGRHTETWTTNSDVKYAYDQLGRVQTVTVTKQNGVTLGTQLVTTYYYTAVSNIDHVTYPNGTETDYGYDSLNRLTSVTNKKGSTVLSSYTYTLENDGIRTGVTEKELESDGTTSTVTKTWTYDNLQRLTQEAVSVSGSVNYASYTDTYTMDLVGNRVAKTHTSGGQTLTVSYTYNSNDQLTAESGSGSSTYSTTYGYDANGSMTSAIRTGSSAETDTYGYDLQNRFSSANISRTESGQSVTIAASYGYDDSGFRANSSVTTTIGTGSPTTTTTQYVVDLNNPTGYSQVLEEHTNGASTPSMSYLIGLSVFGQTNSSNTQNYLLPDGQGSTRLVTDTSGNILIRYAYDAYGTILTTIGVLNPPLSKILYTGQLFDPTLLQFYLRARFYITQIGRFTRLDPLLGASITPATLHRYNYAGQDPINHIDPSGQEFFTAVVGFIGDVAGRLASGATYLATFFAKVSIFFFKVSIYLAILGLEAVS